MFILSELNASSLILQDNILRMLCYLVNRSMLRMEIFGQWNSTRQSRFVLLSNTVPDPWEIFQALSFETFQSRQTRCYWI